MNEILFNDEFQSAWCHDTLSVEKTLKLLNSLLCTAISLIFFMKQYSFKNVERFVQNHISAFW